MRRALIAALTMVLAACSAPTVGTPAALPAAPVKPAALVDNTVVIYDTLGQRVDAHDGDLLQADGKIYLYGTAYGCGFRLNVTGTAYCGVKVYTTTDLRTFTPAGAVGGSYAFDHLTAAWQGLCAPSASHFGCYRPHVVKRPSDGRYVMWIVSGFEGYTTLVSDSPAGPFEPTGVTPVLSVGPQYGDQDITVAPDGRGYVTYTAIDPVTAAHTLVIEQLDAALQTGTGRFVVTDTFPNAIDMAEAPGLFYGPNNTWFLAYSNPAKPYLTTGTGVLNGPRNTADPIGPWTSPRMLFSDSCSGQPAGVVPLKNSAGGTTYVYESDRWDQGNTNQSKGVNYYGALTFTATSIDTGVCQAFWTL